MKYNLNLRELKIFVTVCKTGSMSKTAEKLYVTQPAISQTISDLEEKLNVKLFDRIKRNLNLTHSGKILLKYSQKVLLLIDETQNTIEDIANMKQGQLSIGASMTIGTYLVPNIIQNFSQEFENIKLPFIIDNTSIIERMILDNEIDIGLVEGPIKSEDIIVKPFFDDKLYLVCSLKHKWANKKKINPKEIKTEELIMREEGSGTRAVIENNLYQANLEYNIKHVLNNIEAIKKTIEANMGISFLPKISIEEEIKQNKLVAKEIEGINFTRQFRIIYHKDKYRSPLFKEFINYLHQKTKTSS
ncbi:LysR family transcriptional regulator [Sporohalobacter salinus]|uniref:LysR family transcriptional regulator n=1 Tax=Sporohalobacter salinus TaxID=1494606 RepID=UPI001960E2AB|nr:LysR family transcriptional regulator [Sporohalobacter salinus]MBM7624572.1 DNA-binding transcriptional LysR family regulator [Sporohalobacter salinus]